MKIPEHVWVKARDLGVLTKKELANMVKMSAPATHPQGNRRYEDYIFKIQSNAVEDINNDGAGILPDICPDCENDGGFCLTCGHL